MQEKNQKSTEAPEQGRPRFWARTVEWFTRRERLALARALQATRPDELKQAIAAADDLVQVAASLQELQRTGAAQAVLACSREAVSLLIGAKYKKDLVSALTEHEAELVECVGGGARVTGGRRALIETSPATVPLLPRAEQLRVSLAALEFARALLRSMLAEESQLEALKTSRLVRLVVLFVGILLAAMGLSLAIGAWLSPTDLTRGASWHTSSNYPGFDAQAGTCDGNQTAIFFHTQEEQGPFIQYDLGAVKRVRRVDITNRTDCCRERAVPLLVEVSRDGKAWNEVARRTEPFGSIKLPFDEVEARHLRLRTDDKTWLHLQQVAIRGD